MKPKVFFIAITLLMMHQQPQGLLAQTRPAQRGRTPAPPPAATGPLSVSEVIEGLYSLGSSRAEELVAKRGVKFEGSPVLLSILKEFGASDRLLNLIPRPATPPAKKFAGPLTVICEPKDCGVIVDDKYYGLTEQGRKTVRGLTPGAATIQVFSDGYAGRTEKVQFVEDMPLELKVSFQGNSQVRQQMASDALLGAVRVLGGAGLLLADVEGAGTMDWLDNDGHQNVWDLTFTKRPGYDLSITFKTRDGQCVATIQRQTTKQDCRGKLKNSGEDVAGQTAAAFLKYQLQDSIQQFFGQKLTLADGDGRRLTNTEGDPVSLALGPDGLPTEVIYKSGVKVTYSDYLKLGGGLYPGRVSIGQSDRPPVWIFRLGSVRNSTGRNP